MEKGNPLDVNIIMNCQLLENIVQVIGRCPTCSSAVNFDVDIISKCGMSIPRTFQCNSCPWYQ